jgi:poly(3-hydroxybutyrate) depolymerase
MRSRRIWLALVSGVAALVLFAAWHRAEADTVLIAFKDGFTIRGRVKMETMLISDPASGATFSVPIGGKPYWVDDGVRMIYFAPSQIIPPEIMDDKAMKAEWVKFSLTHPSSSNPMPFAYEIKNIGEFDETKWQRTLKMDLPDGKSRTVEQRITELNPQVLRLDALDRNWSCYYKTSEADPQLLRRLILGYYEKDKEMKGKKLEQEYRVYQFFLQTGFVDAAEAQLGFIGKTFNNQESTIKPLQNSIDRLRAHAFVASLLRADKAGMRSEVDKKLKDYAERDLDKLVDEKSQLQVQEVKDRHKAIEQKLKEAQRLLYGFSAITSMSKRQFFESAAKELMQEVGPDTVDRLETFLSQAQDYERALNDKPKRVPDQTADEVMSFAITGWVGGTNAAEKNTEVAMKQWACRSLLLEYLRTGDSGIITTLKSKGLKVDEAMQILKLLPPPNAEEKISSDVQEMKAAKGKATYELQLPPGYTHTRAWPVMIVLHYSSEKPAAALARWANLAAEHGYILVAPEWSKMVRASYNYTNTEHLAVLETLRDLRQRFQIDSDRVFLYGGEEGATMAMDVGMAHPDQFAGVIPMCGSPRYFPKRCWTNAQYLPMYMINGELGPTAKLTLEMMDDFRRHGFPSIYAQYKGRPSDWFPAEQPIVFDWMNRKKRYHPLKECGHDGEEFRTARATDKQFYWISAISVGKDYITEAGKAWKTSFPAKMWAKVFTENRITVSSSGVSGVTLWFGPKLVDYTQKVTITYNGSTPMTRTITPNLETLLENQFETGDRQQMFFARLDLK